MTAVTFYVCRSCAVVVSVPFARAEMKFTLVLCLTLTVSLVAGVEKRERNRYKEIKKHGKRGVLELGYGLPQQHSPAPVYGPPEPAPVYGSDLINIYQPAQTPIQPAGHLGSIHFHPATAPQPTGHPVPVKVPVGLPFPNPVPAAVVAHPVSEPAVPIGVPIIQTVTKHVGVPVPVPVHVDRPIAVPVAVPVPKPYPVHVEKIVHVGRPVHYPVHVDRLVAVPVAVPVPKPYPVERYVHVAVPVHVPKPYPVPVAIHTNHWKPAAQYGW